MLLVDDDATLSIAPCFRDGFVAYKSRNVSELLRSIAVFEACRIPWIVRNAESVSSCPSTDYFRHFAGIPTTRCLLIYSFTLLLLFDDSYGSSSGSSKSKPAR